ncbi:OmpA family protein [uncultured Nisaea sp.]|jgi:OmpA-OmpF porin, OOP family|uniref:OmpA family protein n=1 Tax=uncultured Nisaea sp. TaxID=538215 RepID=UPI0030EEF2FB|tara:strand:- start:1036 stop:1929 length:894 start_codon:yes stop_codon:yes gene_type:complete
MKRFQNPTLKKSVAVFGVVLLSGCAGMQLDNARKVEPGGSAFSTALYKEYMALSELEFLEGDYADSDVFALRAISAAGNNPTTPEEMSARNIPAANKGELATARRELVEALAATATEKASVNAAQAQASFECWMQEQEENFQPDDIARCRADYMASMNAVRSALAQVPAAPVAAPAPAPKAPLRMAATYTVNFDFDSDAITDAASQIISEAGIAVDEMKASTIILSGYTDRAGSETYNMKLADRRAKAVLSALDIRSNKKIADATEIKVYGEKNNKKKTEDGVREPENRRVKIEIIR